MKETLKLALEALERIDLWLKARYSGIGLVGVELDAITAIKEALAQPEQGLYSEDELVKARKWAEETAKVLNEPEQEPVAWMHFHNRAEPQLDVQLEEPDCIKSFPDDVVWKKPLYTTPPQRTWVGLDEEDDIDWEEGGSLRDLVEAVEAKLKEKNT